MTRWNEDAEEERRHREIVDAIRESGGGGGGGGGSTGSGCGGTLVFAVLSLFGLYYGFGSGLEAFNDGEGVVVIAFMGLLGFVIGFFLGPFILLWWLAEALGWLNEVTSS